MDAKELKEQLTEEDIINIVTNGLKSDGYKKDGQGNLIFQTIDHNEEYTGKYKLYYYADSYSFHSYTIGESFDIYELIERAGKANGFISALYWLMGFLGISAIDGEIDSSEPITRTSDWDLLNKIEDYSNFAEEAEATEIRVHSNSLMHCFAPLLPKVWYEEGIGLGTMEKYGVRMEGSSEKIILPHYNIKGELIGIRARSYNAYDLEEGRKYTPIYMDGELYNHPLGENLYGLNITQHTIRKVKKALIFEGEKSVMKADTFYGDNNFTVASCGGSVSDTQVELLLDLGVNEIIIAFDKENDDDIASQQTMAYVDKLKRIAMKFSPYVNTYFVLDIYNKLEHKDSPIDKGRETLEFLLKHKVLIPSYSNSGAKSGRKGRKIGRG